MTRLIHRDTLQRKDSAQYCPTQNKTKSSLIMKQKNIGAEAAGESVWRSVTTTAEVMRG